MTTEHDPVNHPSHYTAHPSGLECVEITRHLTFDVGNAVKYVWRADTKNGHEDLLKARWYLLDAIEYSDVVILARNVRKWRDLLDLVMQSETDPERQFFFKSIGERDLQRALIAVHGMLGED